MTLKEQIIKIISENLSECVNNSANYHIYGKIPRKKFDGARKSYATNVRYDDVLALIDTTVFGGGERGMLLTTTGIYIKEMLTSPEYHDYSDYLSMSVPGETYYNSHALFPMLQEISSVVQKRAKRDTVKNKIIGAFEIGIDIIDTIANTVDEIENSIHPGIKIYADFIDPAIELNNNIELLELDVENDEFVENKIAVVYRDILELLNKLSDQVKDYMFKYSSMDDIEDEDEFTTYLNWLSFWTLVLSNNKDFYTAFPEDELQGTVELWSNAISYIDLMSEGAGLEKSFSETTSDFVSIIYENPLDLLTLLNYKQEDEQEVSTILSKFDSALDAFDDRLTEIIDVLDSILNE